MKKNYIIIFSCFLFLLIPDFTFSQKNHHTDTTLKKLPKMNLLNHKKVMNELLGKPLVKIKHIGILAYDGVYAMEAIGAMAVFSELSNVKIEYISLQKGLIKSDIANFFADKELKDIKKLDILVVPGGEKEAMDAILTNNSLIEWVKMIDKNTKFTVGIGYGTLLLGKSDLLQHKKVAFNWFKAEENLEVFGAKYIPKRFTSDGKYWTSVNSTAVLDVCLAIIQQIVGNIYLQGAMLDLEYAPAPPLNAGTVHLTDKRVVKDVIQSSYTSDKFHLLSSNAHFTDIMPSSKPVKTIGILVYPGFFTLDALGPLAVFSQMKDVKTHFIAKQDTLIKSGRTRFNISKSIYDFESLDVLLIPGGSSGTWAVTQDKELLEWIIKIDKNTHYTTSVCTGSWVLGAAGLLKGRQATTNWYRAEEMMRNYDAQFVQQRYISDGKYWTSAGVSAGLDLSFALIKEIKNDKYLQQAMLQMEYNPQPPVDAGTIEKTNHLVIDMMQQMYDYLMTPLIKKSKKTQ